MIAISRQITFGNI